MEMIESSNRRIFANSTRSDPRLHPESTRFELSLHLTRLDPISGGSVRRFKSNVRSLNPEPPLAIPIYFPYHNSVREIWPHCPSFTGTLAKIGCFLLGNWKKWLCKISHSGLQATMHEIFTTTKKACQRESNGMRFNVDSPVRPTGRIGDHQQFLQFFFF